jgi:PEGA domain
MSKMVALVATLCFLTVASLAQNSAAQTSSTAVAANGLPILADGTPIKLKIDRNLSSSDAKVGESVECEVVEEVHVGNIVVIQKGSAVIGRVSAAQSKKEGDRIGKLDVSAEFVRLADGNKASLRGAATGDDSNAAILALGPHTLPGKDIKLANGAEVVAYINGSVTIDPRRFAQLGGATTPIPAALIASETTELQISSQPVTAEVTVDNVLVGETPVRVIVRNGDHVLAVRVSGYTGWFRTIHTSGGVMPVIANLETGENKEMEYKDGLSSQMGTCASGVCGNSPGDAARAAKARKAQQNPNPPTDTPKQ